MSAQDGFAVSVDLGTSNTVAVVRWPDGRTRPLLFDGAPIMPSGVYLDQSGRLFVGRDALRMAALDPSRFEPNPKQRVDEEKVLLGGYEVPVVDLFAAILGAVAQAAVEAVGFVPPAILTYPAAWGQPRRERLVAAAVRAGWPPVRLVPEPVAAARYFVEVLRRPVPIGGCLAVFDFGGGTLDVAVLRNGDDGFAVLGTGGVPDLGGLDVDAALVEHLGNVVGPSLPGAWRSITAPGTTTELRGRRLFWDDVRGAKEMLSRTTVAPVAVPGVEHAVHLTREELDRIAVPLLRRAVHETATVISRAGLTPGQLAGLFLVGGSSRLPIVARMLHAELGVAPTVLEQPELPVAEGALAELRQAPALAAAPVSAPARPVSAAPVSPGGYPVSGVPYPTGPVSPGTPLAQPPPAQPPPAPPVRRSKVWLLAAAGVGLVALVATLAVVLWPNDTKTVHFHTFEPVAGARVPIGDGTRVNATFTDTVGDTAYVAWVAEKTLKIGAINLKSGKPAWSVHPVGTADQWGSIVAAPEGVLAFGETYGSGSHGTLYLLDPANGNVRWQRTITSTDEVLPYPNVVVLASGDNRRTIGLDWRTGRETWAVTDPADMGPYKRVLRNLSPAELAGPGGFRGRADASAGGDHLLLQVTSDKKLTVYDTANGHALRSRQSVGGTDDGYVAYDGKLYVVSQPSSSPYQVQMFDLGSLGEPQVVYTATDPKRRPLKDAFAPCGDGFCLLDNVGSDDQSTQLVAIDVNAKRERWRKPVANADALFRIGDRVLATSLSGSQFASALYDPAGRQLLHTENTQSIAARITDGSLLLFSGSVSTYKGDVSLVGVNAADGTPVSLGSAPNAHGLNCSWNERLLVCPTDQDFEVWRFAD